VLRAKFGSLPWRSRSQRDLAAKSCPTHNVVIWSRISKIFHRNDHHIESMCRAQYLGRYLEGQGHSMTLQQNRVRLITSLFEVGFQNYFTDMITILRRCDARNIWVATLKVNVTAWPCSKIVSHNFVIWNRISKLYHRNYHRIMTTCYAQHLGRYLEGQGHSMTLQENRVRPITLLFEIRFWNYFHRNNHHIETTCRAQHLGRYLEGQCHSMTLQQNLVWPINSFFEVGFQNFIT